MGLVDLRIFWRWSGSKGEIINKSVKNLYS